MTRMPRQRFDDLRRILQWSHQPKNRPQGTSYAEHRWMHDGMETDTIGYTLDFHCV